MRLKCSRTPPSSNECHSLLLHIITPHTYLDNRSAGCPWYYISHIAMECRSIVLRIRSISLDQQPTTENYIVEFRNGRSVKSTRKKSGKASELDWKQTYSCNMSELQAHDITLTLLQSGIRQGVGKLTQKQIHRMKPDEDLVTVSLAEDDTQGRVIGRINLEITRSQVEEFVGSITTPSVTLKSGFSPEYLDERVDIGLEIYHTHRKNFFSCMDGLRDGRQLELMPPRFRNSNSSTLLACQAAIKSGR